MTITYGFFNSNNGDRKYTAAQVGDYLQGLISSGVYADDASSLQVISAGGMQLTVKPGRAILNYKFLYNDAPLTLTLDTSSAQDRIDAIVAYMDLTERSCGIIVKKGTPATAPAAPALTRNATRKEYMLASVKVPRLSTQITQVNITDTRGDQSVCGWVTGLITQVPTGTLLLQYQQACAAELAALEAYMTQQQAEWEAYMNHQQSEWDEWFTSLTDELTVKGFIQEYINAVTLSAAATTIQVGIADYVPQEDILWVNVGGIIWQKSGYTISGTGATAAVTFSKALQAGNTVEFRVHKVRFGTANLTNGTNVLAADVDGTVLTDGTTAVIVDAQ